MSTFALIEISPTNAPYKFYKLVINSKCEYDKFQIKIEHTEFKNALGEIQLMIDRLAIGLEIPPKRITELTGRKLNDKIRDFEIRSGRLRVYYFTDPKTGSIIVLGGIKDKKTQKKDIETLRRIKNDFINRPT